MTSVTKEYYLEQNEKFWEIILQNVSTCIRSGKIGYKGRKYPTKQHATAKKAKQFAMSQVNSKIIEGYTDPVQKSPLPDHVSTLKRKSTGLRRAKSTVNNWRKPPKKSDTIRKLSRQSTLILSDLTGDVTPPSVSKQPTVGTVKADKQERQWRKPHRKQSTIRRLANQSSLLRSRSSQTKQSASTANESSITRTVSKQSSLKRTQLSQSSLKRTGSLRKTLFQNSLK